MPSNYFRQIDVWTHQPTDPTWDALMKRVRAADFQGVFIKVFDGPNWMNYWRPEPLAIGGVDDVKEARKAARRHGLKVQFWCVPHPPLLATQAIMAGLVLQHARLIYDAEPDPPFWPDQTPGQVQAFLDAVVATGPKYSQHLCLDARPYHVARIPLAVWAKYCTVALPMCYWQDMGRPAVEVVQEAVETLKANGWKGPRHPIWPILQYADPARWEVAEKTAEKLKCRRVSYWLLA